MKNLAKYLIMITVLAGATACTNEEVGTGVGAAGGAGLGYAVGGGWGAAVGAAGGALVGNQVGRNW